MTPGESHYEWNQYYCSNICPFKNWDGIICVCVCVGGGGGGGGGGSDETVLMYMLLSALVAHQTLIYTF